MLPQKIALSNSCTEACDSTSRLLCALPYHGWSCDFDCLAHHFVFACMIRWMLAALAGVNCRRWLPLMLCSVVISIVYVSPRSYRILGNSSAHASATPSLVISGVPFDHGAHGGGQPPTCVCRGVLHVEALAQKYEAKGFWKRCRYRYELGWHLIRCLAVPDGVAFIHLRFVDRSKDFRQPGAPFRNCSCERVVVGLLDGTCGPGGLVPMKCRTVFFLLHSFCICSQKCYGAAVHR